MPNAATDLFTQLVQAVSTAEALLLSGNLNDDQRRRVEVLQRSLKPLKTVAFPLRELAPTVSAPANT